MDSADQRAPQTDLGRKAHIAILIGRRDWVVDGRVDAPIGLMLINFICQRLFRLNAGSSYPVHFTSVVVAADRLKLGRGVARYLAMSPGLYIQALNGVHIGDDVMLGPRVTIVSANHLAGSAQQWSHEPPIRIGDRVWLAAGVTVLPGVCIGEDAVVGAGSVVTHDVPPGATVGGIPARPLRTGTVLNSVGDQPVGDEAGESGNR